MQSLGPQHAAAPSGPGLGPPSCRPSARARAEVAARAGDTLRRATVTARATVARRRNWHHDGGRDDRTSKHDLEPESHYDAAGRASQSHWHARRAKAPDPPPRRRCARPRSSGSTGSTLCPAPAPARKRPYGQTGDARRGSQRAEDGLTD